MEILGQNSVRSAVSHYSDIDVSSQHLTSNGFMSLRPFYYKHMIPQEHISGQIGVNSRALPMLAPAFGRCRINVRNFYVPFRTVFPNFNEFMSDSIAHNYGNSDFVSMSPKLSSDVILSIFEDAANNPNSTALALPVSGGKAFVFNGSDYSFTSLGLSFYTVLKSLGYEIIPDNKNPIVFSALPLLCYARCYCDWYVNQQYLNSTDYLVLSQLFKFNDPSTALNIDRTTLFNILSFINFVCYNGANDVYLNSWDNPFSPNSGSGSTNFGAADIANRANFDSPAGQDAIVLQDSFGVPYMQTNANGAVGSEYLHTFLKGLTDYVKRNQLSGANACERMLSKFGVQLNSEVLNKSVLVSQHSIDYDFGAVFNQSENNTGTYAGAGRGTGSVDFDYKADEFGMFLSLYSIIPYSRVFEGYDRNNLHLTKLEFFNNEFDNTVDAISRGEVYIDYSDVYINQGIDYLKVWGFAPRYYEYKQKTDFVTAKFSPRSSYSSVFSSWYLNRTLSGFWPDISRQFHSLEFTRGGDSDQYNRIFQDAKDEFDKFLLIFDVKASSHIPARSIFDNYDFANAGNEIRLHSGGAKLN